jgi:ankyrin repeat protein
MQKTSKSDSKSELLTPAEQSFLNKKLAGAVIYDTPIDWLLENRANVNYSKQDGTTVLHDAAFWCSIHVQRLCEARADVDAQDTNGDTPLHHAVSASTDVVRTLVENGAHNLRNNNGATPLDILKGHFKGTESAELRATYTTRMAFIRAAKKREDVEPGLSSLSLSS